MNATEEWLLLDPDPALEYQIRRDLLKEPAVSLEPLRQKIPEGGWARSLLDWRGASGHWGNGAYNPKWTCTHYALYELAQLEVPPDHAACRESAMLLLSHPRGRDGGINYAKTIEYSDVCVNGMILAISRHFGVENDAVEGIIDFLLNVRMPDGGWNCEYFRNAERSSLHTTISVIEGLGAWLDGKRAYRTREIAEALQAGLVQAARSAARHENGRGHRYRKRRGRKNRKMESRVPAGENLFHRRKERNGKPLEHIEGAQGPEALRSPGCFVRLKRLTGGPH